ncbi:MAG: PTS sugar transporter subunit IIB [Holdemanella sp.]|nr:PTS sugar transporter subunit IIB [Holdemanella sp.]
MLRILVCCGGGMSSSYLARNLTKGVKEAGLDKEIFVDFRGFSQSHDVADSFDIMMLCPHLRYRIQDYLKLHEQDYHSKLENTAIYVIPAQMYGLMQIKELYMDALGILDIFKEQGGHPTYFPGEEDAGKIKRNKAYYHVYKKNE